MSKLSLNPQQLKAIKHRSGPLLIIAGAGTGKTTVITERIKYLIKTKNISPQNILAVTFTDKAANEMLERLDVVMPLGYQEPWLGTFHAVCDRILRAEGLAIGLDPGYQIINQTNQWILIKNHLFDFDLKFYRPLGNPTKFISALIKFFSRCQDEDVSVEGLTKFAQKRKTKAKSEADYEQAGKFLELAAAYQTYQDLKINQSILDFGDLITQTLRLFRDRKSVLQKYQHQFQHILVDEFQDTNYAQYQLIKLLAPPNNNPNLVVVGDDDQSIYKFRGAAISNILDFKKDYPKSKEVVLTKNYRSLKPVLNSAYSLIQHNNPDRLEVKLKVNKKLRTTRTKKTTSPPQIIAVPTGESEVDFTIKTILELVAQENYSYKDFAILARANAHLDPYVAGLKRAGLPYQLVGNRGLFDQPEVKDLINFLRVITNPQDSISLFQFLHIEQFNLPAETILGLLNQSKLTRTSLWSIIKAQKNLKPIVDLINKFQQLSLTHPTSKLLHDFILETGYIKSLTSKETVANFLKIKNINLFFNHLRQYETTSFPWASTKNNHITDFVDVLNLWLEAGENPAQAVIEDIDTINLLTVHSAKGLEFPVVFVCNLVAGRFPSIDRRDPIEFPDKLIKETLPEGSSFLQEERRLLYVAMTRAQDYLFLTFAPDYGGLRPRIPSGFLSETELKQKTLDLTKGQLSLLPSPSSPKPRYLTKSGKFDLKFISYSQIDTFLACPLKYKYRYILRVPAEPHHALSFGQTIHQTLHDFHRLELQGRALSLKDLLHLYQNHFIDLGYESETHKKERFKAGKQALKTYYQKFTSLLGKPKLLETNFRLNIAGIPLIGKIDRIDETKSGLEIIDYKTGSTKDQKTVDRDKQLTIYALASHEALGRKITNMSLYFIEDNLKLTTTRTKKDLKSIKDYLGTKVGEIKKSDFSAKPGHPFPCNFCEYNKICPFVKTK